MTWPFGWQIWTIYTLPLEREGRYDWSYHFLHSRLFLDINRMKIESQITENGPVWYL